MMHAGWGPPPHRRALGSAQDVLVAGADSMQALLLWAGIVASVPWLGRVLSPPLDEPLAEAIAWQTLVHLKCYVSPLRCCRH